MATKEIDEDTIAELVQKATDWPSEVPYDILLDACKGLLGELKRYRAGIVYACCDELSCGAKNEQNLGDLMDQLDWD